MKHQHNVVTAGPSAGKSSTIRELSGRGYYTVPEAARILFDQEISKGNDPETVREEPDFHEQVEHTDRFVESNVPEDTVAFYDRSLADNIAYRRAFGSHVPDSLLEECTDRYDCVFLLERIGFEDDAVRSEDPEEAKRLHQIIRETYEDLGYDVIEIGLDTVAVRADEIEAAIEHPEPIH